MSDIPREASELPDEMNLPQALQFAVRLHRDNYLDAAEQIYRRILAAVPDHPDALHFLGVLRHRLGFTDEAIGLLRQAIAEAPDFPDFHLNLGNVLVENAEVDAGFAEFEEALRLRPDYADAWNNLGSLHRFKNRHAEAEAAYQRALELDPEHVGAHNNLGVIYSGRGEIKRATEYFCKAVILNPENPDGHRLLGIAYYTLGQLDKAAEVFRQWLETDPDNPSARHHLAACGGAEAPERASDDYVAYTFDRFASSFEDLLQTRLHYRAPQLILQCLESKLPPAARQLDILDAGCGTGLCGPLLAPWAKTLVGVDLSGGMLDKAKRKQCYDTLKKAELTTFLCEHAASFDLVVSADTLCYFGSLQTVCAAAAAALRPGGQLAFTVESLIHGQAEQGYRIDPSGRYLHSREHVCASLELAGLGDVSIEKAHLRTEGGVPVEGLVVIARRPPA